MNKFLISLTIISIMSVVASGSVVQGIIILIILLYTLRKRFGAIILLSKPLVIEGALTFVWVVVLSTIGNIVIWRWILAIVLRVVFYLVVKWDNDNFVYITETFTELHLKHLEEKYGERHFKENKAHRTLLKRSESDKRGDGEPPK